MCGREGGLEGEEMVEGRRGGREGEEGGTERWKGREGKKGVIEYRAYFRLSQERWVREWMMA